MRKLLLLMLALALVLTFAACGAATDEPEAEAAEAAEGELTCTVEISYVNALAAPDFPADAIVTECEDGILFSGDYAFAEGTTAADVLLGVMQEQELIFASSDPGAYITAVNGLEAGACGELSGWMYSVNGECPLEAADEYLLSDGDQLKLQYTLDMGADLGFTFEEE